TQQRVVLRQGRVPQVFRDRGGGFLQGGQDARRNRVVALVGGCLLAIERRPGARNAVQGLVQCLGRGAPGGLEGRLCKLRRIHAACTVDQVVRFIDQHGHPPLVSLGQRMQQGVRVVVVVVVCHDHIAPPRQFLRKVV